MFERFTDAARNVVVLAQEEARLLCHDYIGTEHLLLGLVAEGNGIAAAVLEQGGFTLEQARDEVRGIVGVGFAAPSGNIPFTPRAKTALERSLRESLQLGHDYIGTEHILLGLASEGTGVAAQVLAAHRLSLRDARAAVLHALGLPEGGLGVGVWRGGARVRQGIARRQNTTPAVAELYVEARRLAGGAPVSSAHMLRSLVAASGSQAERALAALGVDADAVERALGATPVEGTTDETPEDAISRITSISKVGDRIVIELRDEEVARQFGSGTIDLSVALAETLGQLHARLRQEARKPDARGSASMGE
jgi:ATP-dependent Clp protease ATP-binding subunit ClpC